MELKGKYASAKVFTKTLEDGAKEQIIGLLDQDFLEDSKVRIMPDVHQGMGCVIGFTADMGEQIIPNIVGVDIGCFTGDTKIPLLNGTQKTLKQLYEDKKEFWVYSINKDMKIVNGKAIALKTRTNAELVKVLISGGEEIICTPDHKFMLRDGTYKEAIKLNYKDSLMPLYRTYQTRDGYESLFQPSKGMSSKPTHKVIAEEIFDQIPKGFVVHHVNENQFDNTPENLQILSISDHSRIHGKNKKQIKRLKSEEFKNRRIERLKKYGYYDPKFKEKKQDVARQNILKYMDENPEHFKDVVKKNAKRGSDFFSHYNNDEVMKVKQNLGKIRKVVIRCLEEHGLVDEEKYNLYRKEFYNYYYYEKALRYIKQCGFNNIEDVLDEKKWNTVCFNNHKVISVEKLPYKEDVYCLNVDKYHNFALSAGVFVHNCGMLTVELGDIDLDPAKLDRIIKSKVPSGRAVHEGRKIKFDRLQELKMFRELKDTKRIERSIGTLGGGNHFIEVGVDNKRRKYLVIHSGSRNLGTQVANYYQNLAIDLCSGKEEYFNKKDEIIKSYKEEGRTKGIKKALKELKNEYKDLEPKYPKDLCYLTGKYREEYLHDMKICQEYASLNRQIMAGKIVKGLYNKPLEEFLWFETVHNYINFKDNIIRKGAISAYEGERVLIPINMRDGSILGVGKGNPDWNYSAPHGAGRLLSRTQAKETLNLEEFKESMEGIFSTSVGQSTLDESPQAYKPIEDILASLAETVEVLDIIKPMYNFKA